MRALLKEKEQFGYFDDGSGKRYRIGVLFLLAGETQRALEYYSWFEREFHDDVGEPVFHLFWALSEYRNGNLAQASYRLQLAMLSNLYMLPYLIGQPIEEMDIWHGSNWQQASYLADVSDYLAAPNEGEREWIAAQLQSKPFSELMSKYVDIFRQLNHERDVGKRRALLREWDAYESTHLAIKR